jgi:hypothetical protein
VTATLVIACGALSREIKALQDAYGWDQLTLRCLDASLHNRPEKIPSRLRELIMQEIDNYDRILLGYADCGTSGGIDALVDEFGLTRLPGAHCYQMFMGTRAFDELMSEHPGTFFLTDFLVRQFQSFVVKGLGLDEHPELKEIYFGGYERVVYLAQIDDPNLTRRAIKAANYLNLKFERIDTGYGELVTNLIRVVA